ncbi:hypothetical protein H9657_17795 [Cellulomonas sp. Sa3CUA2]|uniref:Uncharacterized protein n=1 Tax=Cellulomonas avistercoris TaxID=2762242 RepID=A0ABR8QI98_9CELL|nr:hypothetical protein [Cellulomonas avistercoris]MBD7920129.1 hypothetical protein [Cellulomonas avistercoris]
MTAPIATVRCAAPRGWVVWPAGDGAVAADRLTTANDSPATHALASAVRTFDDETQTSHPGTLLAGLWQPDENKTPFASMRILVSSPASPRMTPDELLAFAWETPVLDDVEILDVAADPGQLAAGPTVAQIVRGVRRPARRGALARLLGGQTRQVITHVTWYVLPPGTEQTVACRFETSNPYLLEELGLQTNAITDSLVVDLERA